MRKRDPSRRELEKLVRRDLEDTCRIHAPQGLPHAASKGYKTGFCFFQQDAEGLLLVVQRGPNKKTHKFRVTVKIERIT